GEDAAAGSLTQVAALGGQDPAPAKLGARERTHGGLGRAAAAARGLTGRRPQDPGVRGSRRGGPWLLGLPPECDVGEGRSGRRHDHREETGREAPVSAMPGPYGRQSLERIRWCLDARSRVLQRRPELTHLSAPTSPAGPPG